MKKVVIIGASELQNPLILKAKEMGFETHVFAWKCGDIGEDTADFFYPISIVEKEKILEKCEEIKPAAVLTIASELGNITANYLCHKLGLVANSEHCIKVSTNKYEMRQAFSKAGVSVPKFITVSLDDDYVSAVKDMSFPIIIKPTDRSGSRGITKLADISGLSAAVEDSISNSLEKRAIIEEYIDGDEFSCECISFNGEHRLLAITRKYTTDAPHFIETGHIEPCGISDDQAEKVKKTVFQALDALEIRVGASHSEFRIDKNGDVKIIEIGSRMGGDCIGSDLVRLSTGYDFLKMTLQTALGEKPDLNIHEHYRNAAIRFIFSKQDYDRMNQIKTSYPEIIKYISRINITDQKIVDSSTRYGYYIMASDNRDTILSVL